MGKPLVGPSTTYQRHRPERTELYRLVRDHLPAFLELAAANYERPLPKYVEQELRAYLRCGLLEHGFLRAVCKTCGEDLLVAFSCKKRGVCPSCNARRMCDTAAHLVDRVFPEVPLRQWVLSVPFELRLLLARDSDALTAAGRIFAEEILRLHVRRARQRGHQRARAGAITFPQRFGGALNLNVHYHLAVPDGVFSLAKGVTRATFRPLPRPTPDQLQEVTERTAQRVLAWLRRRRLIADDPEELSRSPEPGALDEFLATALGMGQLVSLPTMGEAEAATDLASPPESRSARRGGAAEGFNVHAAVLVPASDREGRERLLRYCARAPVSLERLTLLPDGRVAYALRHTWRPDQSHRIMQPLEFLARLAALIPPPRHPLIRFHGVFAPNCRWRAAVVPEVTEPTAVGSAGIACGAAALGVPPNGAKLPSPSKSNQTGSCCAIHYQSEPRSTPGRRERTPYLDWASLLRRIYRVDVLACTCGGRLSLVELITDEVETFTELSRRGLLPTQLPPCPDPSFAEPIPPDW